LFFYSLQGIVGFLAEDRRINVAITRARRHLAIVCDSETVSHHSFLKSLITYMVDRGEVRSAMEYIHGNIVVGDVTSLDPDYTAVSVKGALGTSETWKTKSRHHGRDNNKKSEKKNKKEKHVSKERALDSNIVNKQTFEGCNDLNLDNNSTELEVDQSPHLNISNVATVGQVSTEETCNPSDVTNLDVDVTSTQSTRQGLTKEQLELEIREFLLSEDTEHEFNPELTAQERFFVHSIAEEVNIEHESKGEGSQRYIVIRKRLPHPVVGKILGFLL